jgi:flagellar hook protein FlgE
VRRDGAPGSPPGFSPLAPETTSDFTASITIHDSLGVAYEAQVYFERRADAGGNSVWGVHVMVGTDEIVTDQVAFNADGALVQQVPGPAAWNPTPPATQGVVIAFDPGTPLGPASTGLDGATCFGSPSTMLTQTQDGYSTGDLVAVEVAPDGVVRGRYTNGRSFVAGQVVLAKFPNNEGLRRIGGNLFAQTLTSGDAALGQPNAGGRGYISQRTLEQSNVDLAEEFVDLIRFQRAFQANSRTVSTTDDLLNEVVNLKR